jgi:hypothetical protein
VSDSLPGPPCEAFGVAYQNTRPVDRDPTPSSANMSFLVTVMSCVLRDVVRAGFGCVSDIFGRLAVWWDQWVTSTTARTCMRPAGTSEIQLRMARGGDRRNEHGESGESKHAGDAEVAHDEGVIVGSHFLREAE